MQTGMHSFPQGAVCRPGSQIPVENCEFSTFSTAFSTGVFHSKWGLWICRTDLHKFLRPHIPFFPLFRPPCFLPQGPLCAKIQDLTEVVHSVPEDKGSVMLETVGAGAFDGPSENLTSMGKFSVLQQWQTWEAGRRGRRPLQR